MSPIKDNKLRVTEMPKVARVTELRIALEAKAIRKKIAKERRPAPRGGAAMPASVEGYPAVFVPAEGYPKAFAPVEVLPFTKGRLVMDFPPSWELRVGSQGRRPQNVQLGIGQ